jgi:hypothetical protein
MDEGYRHLIRDETTGVVKTTAFISFDQLPVAFRPHHSDNHSLPSEATLASPPSLSISMLQATSKTSKHAGAAKPQASVAPARAALPAKSCDRPAFHPEGMTTLDAADGQDGRARKNLGGAFLGTGPNRNMTHVEQRPLPAEERGAWLATYVATRELVPTPLVVPPHPQKLAPPPSYRFRSDDLKEKRHRAGAPQPADFDTLHHSTFGDIAVAYKPGAGARQIPDLVTSSILKIERLPQASVFPPNPLASQPASDYERTVT